MRTPHPLVAGLLTLTAALAQNRPAQPPQVTSPELLSDRRIVFRLLAKQPDQRFPDAKTVRLALERYRNTLDPKKKAGGWRRCAN